jgi:hypothetical protein
MGLGEPVSALPVGPCPPQGHLTSLQCIAKCPYISVQVRIKIQRCELRPLARHQTSFSRAHAAWIWNVSNCLADVSVRELMLVLSFPFGTSSICATFESIGSLLVGSLLRGA